MNFNNDTIDEVLTFYRDYYREEIGELAQYYPKEQTSLRVNFSDLYSFNPDMAQDLLKQPDKIREDLFEDALQRYDLPIDVSGWEPKVRFYNLGPHTRSLEELRDDDVQKLRAISGQVAKASAVRPKVKVAAWECQRDGTINRVPVADNDLTEPHECNACDRTGPFRLDYDQSEIVNHQLIQIKQPPEEATTSGEVGHEVNAHLTGDIVGEVNAGERIDAPGVLCVDYEEGDPTLDFYLDAWDIESVGDDFRNVDIEGHKDAVHELVEEHNPFIQLAESIAPSITGGPDVDVDAPFGEEEDKYWWIRLAVGIATLFGGWRRVNEDGTHHRGSSHTLLIGDPSTGKSTIMEAIEKISPRSASESGKNASGVGLTAAAVRDDFGDSQFSLEPGALVKAHEGVACIDEIDKMDKDGLSRLHSALEKQRLEINKGGIDATLKCETSLLAAGNPEGSRFNDFDSNQSQIDIVSSLLDRFDLVYTLRDEPDEDRDERLAKSVIQDRVESGLVDAGELEPEERSISNPAVDFETLRSWVALGRRYDPVIKSDNVTSMLREFYVSLRQANADHNGDDEDAPVPATVRTLDGLLRLSEGCARLRLSGEVKPIDARVAITLVQLSLNDIGYDPETGALDADIASGRGSQSQQQRYDKVRGIINQLNGEEPADEDNIVTTATDAGIDESAVQNVLQKMKDKGEIYEPHGPGNGFRLT